MRHLLALPALVVLLSAAPPERLGVGIAVVDVVPGVRFGLFEAPGDAVPVATVDIVADEANHTVALGPSAPDWLHPETLWLDYSVFTFRVVRVTDEAMEVVVDTQAGRTLWLRPQPGIEFKPWTRYLVENVTALERLDPASNPLRAGPDASAPSVPVEPGETDCFAAVEVRGEWARVETSDLCSGDPNVVPVEGAWVRWQDGTRLLIGYGTSC